MVCKFLPKLGSNASLVEQDTQSAHSLSIKIPIMARVYCDKRRESCQRNEGLFSSQLRSLPPTAGSVKQADRKATIVRSVADEHGDCGSQYTKVYQGHESGDPPRSVVLLPETRSPEERTWRGNPLRPHSLTRTLGSGSTTRNPPMNHAGNFAMLGATTAIRPFVRWQIDSGLLNSSKLLKRF